MENESILVIDKKEGLNLEFSKLVSMMEYVRWTTLIEVKDLTIKQLDYLMNEESNSIGMLLAHMVSIEKAFQIDTFKKRELSEEDYQILSPALELSNAAREQIKGYSIDYYLNQLELTRKKTIETFQTLPDSWLFEQAPFWWDEPANNFFKWFHVFEDELNHRGQIRLIKKSMLREEMESE